MRSKSKSALKKAEDWYTNLAGQPAALWFRGILQSLDVEFNPSVGVRVSVGQFLERFLFTHADIVAQKRVEESIKNLGEKLKKIKLDQKNFEKNVEEYARLFLRVCGALGSQPYEDLRKAYVNQMACFYDVKYSKERNKLFYQQLLFRLTVDHLHVLAFAEQYLGDDTGQRHENSKTLREAIKNKFVKKGLDEALVYGLIKDLDSIGLLNATQSSAIGGDIHRLYVADLGRKLLEQIKE